MSATLLYLTAASRDDALRIARALVQERLIACANVIDAASSVYWWQGKVEETREAVLIAKTDARNVEQITARVLELHSYENPAVVAVPIVGGNRDYLTWVESESTAWDDGRMG